MIIAGETLKINEAIIVAMKITHENKSFIDLPQTKEE